jgi:hypothetical protein
MLTGGDARNVGRVRGVRSLAWLSLENIRKSQNHTKSRVGEVRTGWMISELYSLLDMEDNLCGLGVVAT